VRLTGDERQRLATSRSVNPDAYVLVLKGRHFWNRRTLEDFEKAIAAFNDAIALEPGYAAAHAGLADAYLTRADYSAIVRRGDFALGKAAALKALELDETLAEAHTSLAHVLWADGDVAGAEREYTRAIALNPGYATAHHWYGNYLRAQGRPDEAMAELRRAVAIDPLSPIINTAIGGHYHSAGNYSEAIRQLRATVDLNPTFPNAREFLGTSYLQAGMHELAIVEFEKAVELSGRGDLHLGKLGHAYAVSGRTADAQRILAELLDLRSRSPVSATNIALVYVGLGDKDQAFAWLESARQDGDERLLIVRSPVFESLRSDQRFDRLVERAGLPR
jgi:Flp pilus assembly protein TadD